MRQISFARRHSISENRRKKVPLNTVILPPILLTSTSPENFNENEHIFQKIVVTNKSKTGIINNEILPSSKPQQEEMPKTEEESTKTPEQVRLEQNIRFLQDQHQLMLAGLHGEIEKLKTRNRELQFQLIFGKITASSTPSSPSSSEEETKHKVYTSPKILTNYTPLQIELLEKELGEMKLQMQEQESRNVYLSAIVDEQKKQLERYDRRREKEQQRSNNAVTAAESEAELIRKLEEAETLIRRLRRENSDLRRENHQRINEILPVQQVNEISAQHSHNNGGFIQSPRGPPGGHRGGNGRGHRSNNSHNYRGGWFPPLHTQNFWQGGGRPQQQQQQQQNLPQEVSTNLPELSLNDSGGGNSSTSQNYQHHHHHHHGNNRKGSNNNHYHNDGRKYRGGHNNKGNKPS